MHLVVLGCGALGGMVAHHLVRGGCDVSVIGRGETLSAISGEGLTLEQAGRRTTVRLSAAASLFEVPPADVVLLCVPADQTAAAVDQIRRHMVPATLVVSLQGGVDNEQRLCQTIHPSQVLGGVVDGCVETLEPGLLRQHGEVSITLGTVGATPPRRVETLLGELAASGVTVHRTDDLVAARWAALIAQGPTAALCAIGRCTPERLLEDPATAEVLHEAMGEVAAVAASKGIALPHDVVGTALRTASALRGPPSLLQRLNAHKPLEHQALVGLPVREGARLRLRTPVLSTLLALLQLLDPATTAEPTRAPWAAKEGVGALAPLQFR